MQTARVYWKWRRTIICSRTQSSMCLSAVGSVTLNCIVCQSNVGYSASTAIEMRSCEIFYRLHHGSSDICFQHCHCMSHSSHLLEYFTFPYSVASKA